MIGHGPCPLPSCRMHGDKQAACRWLRPLSPIGSPPRGYCSRGGRGSRPASRVASLARAIAGPLPSLPRLHARSLGCGLLPQGAPRWPDSATGMRLANSPACVTPAVGTGRATPSPGPLRPLAGEPSRRRGRRAAEPAGGSRVRRGDRRPAAHAAPLGRWQGKGCFQRSHLSRKAESRALCNRARSIFQHPVHPPCEQITQITP